LLIHAVPHRVIHDLESLFFVLLFICTHLDGLHNSVADPSPMHSWLTMSNLRDLGYLKLDSMLGHFEKGVLTYISSYFDPLKPHLLSWWRALHPNPVTVDAAQTTYHDPSPSSIIDVFKQALIDPNLVHVRTKNTQTLKCSFDNELTQGGWDVVYATNTTDPVLGGTKL